MTTASSRFFQIPELVLKLASKLDKSTLTKFLRTNHHFNAIGTPFLYTSLDFSAVGPGFSTQLVDTVESMEILAKNVHHIHELTSGPLFSAFLYNCLLTYHEQSFSSSSSSSPSARNKTLPRLPRIDPPTETLTPLPPLVHLKQFTYTTYFALRLMKHHIFMPSSRYPRIRQAQLYWFLEQCAPSLTDLSLEVMFLDDYEGRDEGVGTLAQTLRGMKRLRRAEICVLLADDDAWPRVMETLFFGGCCCVDGAGALSALEEVRIRKGEYVEVWYDRVPLNWSEPEPDEWVEEMANEVVEEEEEEEGEEVVEKEEATPESERIENPLSRLRSLDIYRLETSSLETIRSIFRACPDLRELYIPHLYRDVAKRELAEIIVKSCPRLNQLRLSPDSEIDFIDNDWSVPKAGEDRDLAHQLMRALPEQSLQVVEITGYRTQEWEFDVELIQRHSATLREIRIEDCRYWSTSMVVQSIICNCRALEVLRVQARREPGCNGRATVELEDLVESEWVCKGLVELYLLVGVQTKTGRLDVDREGEEVKEWDFEGRMPIFLTEEEGSGLYERLMKLRGQVGRLERLERVELSAVLSADGEVGKRFLALTRKK